MSDYLWDKTGIPDPEIQRLEELLEPLRYRPGVVPIRRSRSRLRYAIAVGIAAAVVVAVFIVRPRSHPWSVSLESADRAIRTAHLRAGETLRTAPGQVAHLTLAHVGRLDVDPETTLRVLSSRSDQQRLELLSGTIHAHIGAPPRVFVVNTPSATATDLGCSYTLHVDPSGDGLLRVTSGLIEFDWKTRRALVPTGAVAITRVGAGPGTPFFDDAPPGLRAALQSYDFAHQQSALPQVLASARPRDAMTLLNLVQTVRAPDRTSVLATLAKISPPPPGVDLSAIAAGHFDTLQPWWNAVTRAKRRPAVRLF
jgi:hypothetical protein